MTQRTAVAVRPARAGDAPEVRRLVAAMGGHEEIAGALRFAEVFAAAMASSEVRAFMAESEGRPVGYAELHRRLSTLHACREGWLAALAVDPAVRRGGAGRALITAVEAAAAELGCQEIVLESSTWREPARAFYLGLGFVDQSPAHRYRRRVTGGTSLG